MISMTHWRKTFADGAARGIGRWHYSPISGFHDQHDAEAKGEAGLCRVARAVVEATRSADLVRSYRGRLPGETTSANHCDMGSERYVRFRLRYAPELAADGEVTQWSAQGNVTRGHAADQDEVRTLTPGVPSSCRCCRALAAPAETHPIMRAPCHRRRLGRELIWASPRGC